MAALRRVVEASNILTVQGNGEAKLLRGEVTIDGLGNEHLEGIRTWPLVISWSGHLVLHGGIDPTRPPEDHTPEDIRTLRSLAHGSDYRSPFWFERYEGSERIFFGHTALRSPLRATSAIGLDTGCVYGGSLTAYDVQDDRFVSVPARRIYRPRDPAQYADRNGTEAPQKVGEPPEPDLDQPGFYLNRELSELEFQRRVLDEARDERNPLLERIRFLAIFTKNMDEFFMKRIGGLKQQISAGLAEPTPDGRSPLEQWREALERARALYRKQHEVFQRTLLPALAEEGIRIVGYKELSDEERQHVGDYFHEFVLPTLTPLTFDLAHPFPFISNLSLSLAVLTQGCEGEECPDETFSRVKIPKNRPRLNPRPSVPRSSRRSEGGTS